MALSASWNVSGYNETGFAFGMITYQAAILTAVLCDQVAITPRVSVERGVY